MAAKVELSELYFTFRATVKSQEIRPFEFKLGLKALN